MHRHHQSEGKTEALQMHINIYICVFICIWIWSWSGHDLKFNYQPFNYTPKNNEKQLKNRNPEVEMPALSVNSGLDSCLCPQIFLMNLIVTFPQKINKPVVAWTIYNNNVIPF